MEVDHLFDIRRTLQQNWYWLGIMQLSKYGNEIDAGFKFVRKDVVRLNKQFAA